MADAPPPAPDPQTLARMRQRFLRPALGDPAFLERSSICEALAQLSHRVEHGHILDLGCGIKPYEPLLARPGDRWIGVDHPPTMAGSYGTLTLADFFADCHTLPFAAGSFDTVVCTQVLEHVRNPGRVLAEAARVLRPGGVLVLTAPMVWPLHEEPYDYFRYTRHGLRALIEAAGLVVEQEIQRGHGLAALAQSALDLHFAGKTFSRLGKVYLKLCCGAVNLLCSRLDRWLPAKRLTLGWAIAARKPASGASSPHTPGPG